MKICFIIDTPEILRHPFIVRLLQRIQERHSLRLLKVFTTAEEAIMHEVRSKGTDLYLLRSRRTRSLEVAHFLEQQGALVVNSFTATQACQDRVLMAERMQASHLCWPQTRNCSSLRALLEDRQLLSHISFPIIIKSRNSRPRELVKKIDTIEELQACEAQWSQEPFVFQEFLMNDGWDVKLWAIDQQVFAAWRSTPLRIDTPRKDFPIIAAKLPVEWIQMALDIGRIFHLYLYGIDLVIYKGRPIVVDVNAFPGFQSVPDADILITNFIERFIQQREVNIWV